MPLEPIEPREVPPIDRWKTRVKSGLAVLGVVLCLAGCAEGTARDAERGRAKDADATSVIDALQSTRTTEIITGTPDASPAP
jgi:hypothetical protein